MATYLELHSLSQSALSEQGSSTLLYRIQMAVCAAAEEIKQEPLQDGRPTPRTVWAISAIRDSESQAKAFLLSVLMQYRSKTVAELEQLTDEEIQSAVNDTVNLFAL